MTSAGAHEDSVAAEIASGTRFAFGENWLRFLDHLDDAAIDRAEASMLEMLGPDHLRGRRFLDVGCGSGLSSLVARRLGADVRAFDVDPASVAAAVELRRRLRPEDPSWKIGLGDILDADFVSQLGNADVVYSWGVLHHSGDMWQALAGTMSLVAPGGLLWVALYNDQGAASRIWTEVKRRYNKAGPLGKRLWVGVVWCRFAAQALAVHALRSLFRWEARSEPEGRDRGMYRSTDIVDWVGGWPFEVSKPEQVLDFARSRGFELERLFTCGGGLGCNEYLFRRPDGRSSAE